MLYHTATVVGCAQGGNGGSLFSAGGTVILNASQVSGNVSGDGSVGGPGGSSGGIYVNAGTLSINHSTISGNTTGRGGAGDSGGTGGDGGGIWNTGATLTVSMSAISGTIARCLLCRAARLHRGCPIRG